MALTLLEAAKIEPDVIKRNVVEVFPMVSPILEAMPFINVPGGVFKYNREQVLPGISFRGIGEDYTESTGVLQQNVEVTKIFGGKAQVDRALLGERGESVGELRAVHDRLKAKAAALFFTKMFFDGDAGMDPRQFDGLNARLVGDQVIAAGDNGASLTTDMLDDLIDGVAGEPDMLLMSKAMRREVTKLLRADGRITYGEDAFGRQVTMYGGIPIRIVEEDHEGSAILGFDETQGTSDAAGSIYAVRFGAEEYLSGIQNTPMDVLDMGLQSDLKYLTVIEWLASFVILHPKSAARLKGVTQSA
jgi:hypothetical protein